MKNTIEVKFLVSNKYKFLVAFNQKCGSTTIKWWFYCIHNDLNFMIFNKTMKAISIHDFYKKTPREVAPLFDENFNIPPYYKFCVIRNPYARIVSSWLGIISNKRWMTRRGEKMFPNFTALIEHLYFDRKNSFHWNRHWGPQHYCFGDMNFEFDRVCRLENIQEDLNLVSEELGIRKLTINSKGNKGKYSGHYSNFIDLELKEMIDEIYDLDFEILCYPKEL